MSLRDPDSRASFACIFTLDSVTITHYYDPLAEVWTLIGPDALRTFSFIDAYWLFIRTTPTQRYTPYTTSSTRLDSRFGRPCDVVKINAHSFTLVARPIEGCGASASTTT